MSRILKKIKNSTASKETTLRSSYYQTPFRPYKWLFSLLLDFIFLNSMNDRIYYLLIKQGLMYVKFLKIFKISLISA